ncbi:hypothetical protein V494_07000 [Pseudogymnoascus sp. VKM F-4513 (FW-928)]|nr:hypothetical protein V494_07000 [Pseudogymnoascus sp. VKM F-4513 (FW-928)]
MKLSYVATFLLPVVALANPLPVSNAEAEGESAGLVPRSKQVCKIVNAGTVNCRYDPSGQNKDDFQEWATGEYCCDEDEDTEAQRLTGDEARGTGPITGDVTFQDTILTRSAPRRDSAIASVRAFL